MSPLRRLPPRDRRALLIGAALLIPVVLFRGVVQPYVRARAALGERVRTQRDLLARERAVLDEARSLPERRARADVSLAADAPRLLPGADLYAATAELVGYVGETARRSHVLVQELQSRSAPSTTATEAGGEGGLAQIHVELRGQTDFEGVLRLLLALERGSRLVRVDALAVERSSEGPGGREMLSLRAALSGYSAATPSPSGASGRPQAVPGRRPAS